MIGIFTRRSRELEYWLALSLDRRERHTPNWMKVLTALGWFLIILGVIGEFATEGLVSRADGTLQTFNDILLSDARKEAAFAIERSAGAYERAAKTEQEASQENERAAQALNAAEVARKNAEGFQLEIAKANERAARAEQEAAEANKAAESERIERLKLEASIAGRRLTAEQKEKLKSLLKAIRSDNDRTGMDWSWRPRGSRPGE